VTDPLIVEHYGRVVSTAGDSILAEFPSAVEAVSCAVEIQGRLAQENVDLPPDRQMRFRIGINLGDVIVDGADVDGSCPPWRLAQCAAKSASQSSRANPLLRRISETR
jgi:adenylate cyclase